MGIGRSLRGAYDGRADLFRIEKGRAEGGSGDWIRKLSIEGSPDRYDKIRRHDHLVCKRCGALSDITFEDMTGDLERQLGEGILSYDLKVFYLCPKCREKKEKGVLP